MYNYHDRDTYSNAFVFFDNAMIEKFSGKNLSQLRTLSTAHLRAFKWARLLTSIVEIPSSHEISISNQIRILSHRENTLIITTFFPNDRSLKTQSQKWIAMLSSQTAGLFSRTTDISLSFSWKSSVPTALGWWATALSCRRKFRSLVEKASPKRARLTQLPARLNGLAASPQKRRQAERDRYADQIERGAVLIIHDKRSFANQG